MLLKWKNLFLIFSKNIKKFPEFKSLKKFKIEKKKVYVRSNTKSSVYSFPAKL